MNNRPIACKSEICNLKSEIRSGFTLVEMLVAMALTIFIMSIITTIFAEGLKAFSKLKSVTDLDNRLRAAVTILRRDLKANHFEGDLKLSQLGTTRPGAMASPGANPFFPPELGFFSYREASVANPSFSTPEGGDAIARQSARDVNDCLHFTVRLNGNRREDYFFARVLSGSPLDNAITSGFTAARYDVNGDGLYSSQWAEVIYFLQPKMTAGVQDLTTVSGGVQLPLFNLHRRELNLVPEFFTGTTGMVSQVFSQDNLGNNLIAATAGDPIEGPRSADYSAPPYGTLYQSLYQPPPATGGQEYQELSAFAQPFFDPAPTIHFRYSLNSPASVQFRERRFNYGKANYLPAATGGDLLLTNILSFDVKVFDPFAIVAVPPRGEFVDLAHFGASIFAPDTANTTAPFFGGAVAQSLNHDINLEPDLRVPPNHVVYDTLSTRNGEFNYSADIPPYPFAISALQIKIRIWDPKSQQAREVTIIQDM